MLTCLDEDTHNVQFWCYCERLIDIYEVVSVIVLISPIYKGTIQVISLYIYFYTILLIHFCTNAKFLFQCNMFTS